MKDEKGFTLFEVLLTLLMLALLFSLAQTSIGSLADSIRLRSETETLAWVLRETRQQAISTNQRQTVQIYAEENFYRYPGEDGPIDHALPPGVTFDGAADLSACTFNPSGAPSRGGHISLQSGSRQMFVIINPDAGRIRTASQLTS
jgi:prepilin-type N-terminal cleavage/methylation domain-containing protein